MSYPIAHGENREMLITGSVDLGISLAMNPLMRLELDQIRRVSKREEENRGWKMRGRGLYEFLLQLLKEIRRSCRL